jgi:CRISPR type III-associated protein (TIGR04423 family)
METIKIKNCEGYLWWSNREEPEILDGKALDVSLDETKNPFVVEGQLYDKEEMESYSIKYVDGQYLVNIYKVEARDFTNKDNEPKTFLSNRMGGRWLKFLRYWEEKKDENSMNMPVLTFTKNVFIGFKEKEDKL